MIKELKDNNMRLMLRKTLILKLYEHNMFKATYFAFFVIKLGSCATDFSAPVSERSEKLEIRSPIIVVNSELDTNTTANFRLAEFSNQDSENSVRIANWVAYPCLLHSKQSFSTIYRR